MKVGTKSSILQDKIKPSDKNTIFFLLYKSENKHKYIPKYAHNDEKEYGVVNVKVVSENMLIQIKIKDTIKEVVLEQNLFKIK